jgi:hypothetical protein
MSIRWVVSKQAMDESTPAVDAFVEDIIAVCRKHNLVLSHSSDYPSFVVEPMSEFRLQNLQEASDAVQDSEGQ